MSKKNKSIKDLQDSIDSDFILRRDELKICTDLVKRNLKAQEGSVYAKILIVCLYAHWEGFIKYASECFLQFVHHQSLKNKDLNYGLLAISRLSKVKDYLEANVALKIRAVEDLIDSLDEKAIIPYSYSIATYSKLNTETLEEICLIVGIDNNHYATKKGIIDEKLVRNRNDIAHGALIPISPDESIEIYELVFPILESYKTDILNRAVLINNQAKTN